LSVDEFFPDRAAGGQARHHDTDGSSLQVVEGCSSDSLQHEFSLISPVAKSHQPLRKWLEGAAPAVGVALIIASAHPATAQPSEAPQRAEIAIPMSDQGIRAAGILTARVSPAQGRSDLSFPGTVIIPSSR
jgi:hypothetical protein